MMGPTWFLFLVAALYGVLAALIWKASTRKTLSDVRAFAMFLAGLGVSFLVLGLAHLH